MASATGITPFSLNPPAKPVLQSLKQVKWNLISVNHSTS